MVLSRRDVLAAGGVSLVVVQPAFAVTGQALRPTDPITNIPEYTPGAPQRRSFLSDARSGERIRVFGSAVTPAGEPIAGARLDFWHTDARGVYDTTGYNFRGRQRTDQRGRFVLDTVMPGSYGNPLHVHFLLIGRAGAQPQPLMLSGAIYFPNEREYAARADLHPLSEFLPPDAVPVVDGVRMAHCDIVMEAEPSHGRASLQPTYAWREVRDYYGWMPNAPAPPSRSNLLEPEDAGERVEISGRVLTRAGAPLADARLEFWDPEAAGPYERTHHRLRGVQRTRADGSYAVETLLPGSASGMGRINYLASAVPPGRRQPLYVHAGVFFATDEALRHRVDPAMRALVRPGARTYGDDAAFLRLSAMPVENGVRRASYDIVFDVA